MKHLVSLLLLATIILQIGCQNQKRSRFTCTDNEDPTASLKEVRLTSSVIIDAPIQQIWPVQSDFAQMQKWYKTFSSIAITNRPQGSFDANTVGTKRDCALVVPGKYIREELLAFDASRYTYSYHMFEYKNKSENPLPFRCVDHRADVRLFPITSGSKAGSTYVRWSIHFWTDEKNDVVINKVMEGVFGALFTHLGNYFKDAKKDNNFNTDIQSNGKSSFVNIFQGTVLDGNTEVVWNAFNGNSPLWTPYVPSEALLSHKPDVVPSRNYNFRNAAEDGYRFRMTEEQLYTNSEEHLKRVSMKLEFGHTEGLRSIKSHTGRRAVYPVVFPVGGPARSVLVWEDSFALTDNSHLEEANKFFNWFGNSVFNFVEKTLKEPSDLALGKKVTRIFTTVFTLPTEEFWHSFDDYVKIQEVFSGHDGMVLLNPTRISFNFEGMDTVEDLILKDDEPPIRIWKVGLAQPNTMFSFWEATVTISDTFGSTGLPSTHATLMMEFVLLNKDEKVRAGQLAFIEYCMSIRLQEIARGVGLHNGIQHKYEPLIFNYPTAELYAIFSNWSDTTWVQHSLGATYNPYNSGRYVWFGNGFAMLESRIHVNWVPGTREFSYLVEPSDNMQCAIYSGDIKFEELDGGKRTKVEYISNIHALPGKDLNKVKEDITSNLNSRFKWLVTAFDKSK